MRKLMPRNGSLKLGRISDLPRHIWFLLAVYFVASSAHFVHNAAYIAYYPNMPSWITSDRVYVAWAVVTGVGIAGLVALRLRLHAAAAVFMASARLSGTAPVPIQGARLKLRQKHPAGESGEAVVRAPAKAS